ncbi:MAG: transposase, partial [Kiritimatiellae bacterium]|nr:transposase [Kiritimatiellia bacterium]
MITVFAQIVQRLPGYLIERLAEGQKVKAREFSYSAQLYTLMLGQFLHAFSLNELVDISEVHKAELSRIRGIRPAKRNTFSYANRNRDPKVAQDFYWALRDWFDRRSPGFRGLRNRGALARFRTRHIYAVDASLIPLSLCCIDWAKYIHRKSAAKLHMRTNVANMLPDFVAIDSASRHEAKKAPAMCADLRPGDVVVGDRGYYSFDFFRELDGRGIVFVSRERRTMKCRVVRATTEAGLGKGIVSDERVVLTD